MSKTSNFLKTTAILSTALFTLLGGCLVEDPIDYTTATGSVSDDGGQQGTDVFDSTAPVAVSLLIDNGAASTNTTAVTLDMSATDDVAVTDYYASESTSTPQASDSGWESYQQSTSFTLSGSNSLGVFPRTVNVWFKDAAGNVSESVDASISLGVYDTTAPNAVSVVIDGGAESFTSSAGPTCVYYAAGLLVMGFDGVWYGGKSDVNDLFSLPRSEVSDDDVDQNTIPTNFSEGDGFSLFGTYDFAGNAGNIVVGPAGCGSTVAEVNLTLSATDDQAVTNYYASESAVTPQAGDSGWDNYSTSVSYSFDNDTAGTKTVNVWFKDAAGNVSALVSDQIELMAASAEGTVEWIRQMGTPGTDLGSKIASDNVGNVFVTGYSQNGGLDNNTSSGLNDIILVKHDSSGVKQWTRQIGTSIHEEGYAIATDSNGNVYVAGRTSGILGSSRVGWYDAFVIKFDNAGNQQWVRQFGSTGLDEAWFVAVDNSDNIYITGDVNGSLDGMSYAGGMDIFLVKYDSAGNRIWSDQIGTAGNDYGGSIAFSDGHVYVSGMTSGGLDGQISNGSSDTFVMKYDDAGNRIWTRLVGTAGAEGGGSIVFDGSGNYYVAATTDGAIDSNGNFGGNDVFLIKYNSAGNKQWTQQFGTSLNDVAGIITSDNNGNLYVTGYTEGSLDNNSNAGSNDVFLIKYNSAGNKQWTQQLGTTSSDTPGGITSDSNGNVYVSGSTNGSLDGNTSAGGQDLFVVKFK